MTSSQTVAPDDITTNTLIAIKSLDRVNLSELVDLCYSTLQFHKFCEQAYSDFIVNFIALLQ